MSNDEIFLLLRWFGTRSTSHEMYQEKKEKMEATKLAQKWQESDPQITKMTGGTCREGCGPCGGSRGGPEEQGKHLHRENIGKHLEMHQHQGKFQFHYY